MALKKNPVSCCPIFPSSEQEIHRGISVTPNLHFLLFGSSCFLQLGFSDWASHPSQSRGNHLLWPIQDKTLVYVFTILFMERCYDAVWIPPATLKMGDVVLRSRVNETKGGWLRYSFRSPKESLEIPCDFGLLSLFLLTQTPISMHMVPASLEGCCCCDSLAKASVSLLNMAWVSPSASLQTLLTHQKGHPRGKHGNAHLAKQKQTDKELWSTTQKKDGQTTSPHLQEGQPFWERAWTVKSGGSLEIWGTLNLLFAIVTAFQS